MVPKSDMKSANQMNGLYPIIRRVRRPLLPVLPERQHADAKPVEVTAKPDSRKPTPQDPPKVANERRVTKE